MTRLTVGLSAALGVVALAGCGTAAAPTASAGAAAPATQCAPGAGYPAATTAVAFWSTEARCAIVPAGPNGVFGRENFGTKFPGEAAVYMGIVHAAIYDAAVAVEGGYRPYAPTPRAPANTSPEAAVAAAAHDTLTGLQPQLGADQTVLDHDYDAYLAGLAGGTARQRAATRNGIAVGRRAARAVLALRSNDGRGCTTTLQELGLPAAGPGVWQPNPSGAVLGLCLPGMRPLALRSGSQFRPAGPPALTSRRYAKDLRQVEALGRADSPTRSPEQTNEARFWTDHDIRQWNDGLLGLAAAHGLDLVRTARLLAMAHVAGADAMIACFDAKYHYWFWRPNQAIARADTDGNPATAADPTWQPLGATPNFPEYPSAHACHSSAVVAALDAFFGTDRVALTLTSRAPGLSDTARSRTYRRLHDIVADVDQARVLVGFHFRTSDLRGSSLGRSVGRYVTARFFRPVRASHA
jgi:hypothetical protein